MIKSNAIIEINTKNLLYNYELLAKTAKTNEEALGHYRKVRDEIRAFIETLPEGLY